MASSANILALASATQSVSSFAGSYVQSQAIREQGRYERSVMASNARIAELEADDAIRRGEKDEAKHRRETRKLIGAQRAAIAAQGIDVNDGSAVDVQLDTASLGEQDALTIRNNAWREAWGFRAQALESRSRGNMAYKASRNASRQTLLTGGLNAVRYGLEGYGHYRSGKEPKKEV